eukprot:1147342-Pelagomonas_calceolata.AAC.2
MALFCESKHVSCMRKHQLHKVGVSGIFFVRYLIAKFLFLLEYPHAAMRTLSLGTDLKIRVKGLEVRLLVHLPFVKCTGTHSRQGINFSACTGRQPACRHCIIHSTLQCPCAHAPGHVAA